jgi:tRNA A37 methylthiotransferase MiaB
MNIGLVQINNSFSDQSYLPYSIGLLKGYASEYAASIDQYQFTPPIFKETRIDEAVEHLEGNNIVFFSTYIWNNNVHLEIARRLKLKHPNINIVFGGPQISSANPQEYIQHYDWIDIVCVGEGEIPFTSLLDYYSNNVELSDVPSITYRHNRDIYSNPKLERIKDLDTIPSPYVNGCFDDIMNQYPDERWVAIWETNRGCPFSCSFCDWGSAVASKLNKFGMKRLIEEIDWFADRKIVFVSCADANFGILPRDVDLIEYITSVKMKYGYPPDMSVQSTKNITKRIYSIHKMLLDANMSKGVVLSVQSLNDDTLDAIKRDNISLDTYRELQNKFTLEGIDTITDVIIALPEETYESFTTGVSTLMSEGQHNRIIFANLSILDNAEMGDKAYQQKYGMQMVECKVNIRHGKISDDVREIPETQQLCIATDAMPVEDWVRVRIFSWMTEFLHFSKLLQIPIITVNNKYGIDYKTIIEKFITTDPEYPIISAIVTKFLDKAVNIQAGDYEYIPGYNYLGIWWPPATYMIIDIIRKGKFRDLYEEFESILYSLVDGPDDVISDSIKLNRAIFKLPFEHENEQITVKYNIWEHYRGIITGHDVPLMEVPTTYSIIKEHDTWNSWDQWYRDVMWLKHRGGGYIHTVE